MYVSNSSVKSANCTVISYGYLCTKSFSVKSVKSSIISYGFTGSFLGFKQGMLIFCQFPVSFLRYKESSVFFLDSIGRPWLAFLFLQSREGNLFYFFRISEFRKMVLRPLLLLLRKDANYYFLFRIEANCLCTMDFTIFAQLQWLFNLKTHRQTTSLYFLTCNRQTKTSILCQVDN